MKIINIIIAGLAILSLQSHAFEIPGINQVDYQGETAFTDHRNEVLLIANVIDMGGSSVGLGADLSIEQVKQNIGHKINAKQPDAIVKTPLQGIYQLYFARQVLYVDGTGRFMFRNGRLVSSNGTNLTSIAESNAAKLQASKNLKMLAQIADSEMLVYSAGSEHGAELTSITILTDVDCSFCQRIHSELSTYTNAGITVKYLFYPRAGRQSKAYTSFVSVWCSESPKIALDKVETGQHIPIQTCDNPVNKHLELANAFGLIGTPVIFFQDGTMMVGYKPPKQLIKLALMHSQ